MYYITKKNLDTTCPECFIRDISRLMKNAKSDYDSSSILDSKSSADLATLEGEMKTQGS